MTTRDIIEDYGSILTYPVDADPLELIRELGEPMADTARFVAASNLQAQVTLLETLEATGALPNVRWAVRGDGEPLPETFPTVSEALTAGRAAFGAKAVVERVREAS